MLNAIVYGALRSGSTMLRLMLDEHSELGCSGEHDYLFDYIKWEGSVWRYDFDALAIDRIFLSEELELPVEDKVDIALPLLLKQISKKNDAKISVLMLHRNIEKAISLLPNASVIHLVRDPRDVARSYVGMGWNGNSYCAVEGWIKAEKQWKSISKNPDKKTIELRYEELVADPEGQLDRICNFLELSYEPSMLSYPENSTYSAPDHSLAEQWRRKMPVREQRLVEARLGPLLTDSGYPLSGQPPLRINSVHDRLLKAGDAFGRNMHALNRYGLLHVQHILGRKFSINSLEISAQKRKDKILTENYLR